MLHIGLSFWVICLYLMLLLVILVFSHLSNSYLDLEMVEFTIKEVLVASSSQVMLKSSEKGIRIVNDVMEATMTEILYGDSLRLQQVLADFLSTSINFTSTGSRLIIAAYLTKDRLGESVQLARLELR